MPAASSSTSPPPGSRARNALSNVAASSVTQSPPKTRRSRFWRRSVRYQACALEVAASLSYAPHRGETLQEERSWRPEPPLGRAYTCLSPVVPYSPSPAVNARVAGLWITGSGAVFRARLRQQSSRVSRRVVPLTTFARKLLPNVASSERCQRGDTPDAAPAALA